MKITDGCCEHGILVGDPCFDCGIAEAKEADRKAKRAKFETWLTNAEKAVAALKAKSKR